MINGVKVTKQSSLLANTLRYESYGQEKVEEENEENEENEEVREEDEGEEGPCYSNPYDEYHIYEDLYEPSSLGAVDFSHELKALHEKRLKELEILKETKSNNSIRRYKGPQKETVEKKILQLNEKVDQLNTRITRTLINQSQNITQRIDFSTLSVPQRNKLYELFWETFVPTSVFEKEITNTNTSIRELLDLNREWQRKELEDSLRMVTAGNEAFKASVEELKGKIETLSTPLSKVQGRMLSGSPERLKEIEEKITSLSEMLSEINKINSKNSERFEILEEKIEELYEKPLPINTETSSFVSEDDVDAFGPDLVNLVVRVSRHTLEKYGQKQPDNSLLEKHSSELNELWQLARRTSREVSEAKATVWESQEAQKLKQNQEEQAFHIKSQDALIAEMRKRLDILETENARLRQEVQPRQIIRPPQDAREETKAEKDKGLTPGKYLLICAMIFFAIYMLITSYS